jgi:hypothetical protein
MAVLGHHIYVYELELQERNAWKYEKLLIQNHVLDSRHDIYHYNFTLKTSRFHCSDLMQRNQTFKY